MCILRTSDRSRGIKDNGIEGWTLKHICTYHSFTTYRWMIGIKINRYMIRMKTNRYMIRMKINRCMIGMKTNRCKNCFAT